MAPEAQPNQHRINRHIRVPQIRVIGPEGDQLGIMTPDEARDIAAEHGLDLVEVADRARPPVCKIMDYGKFKYEQSKKASASSRRVEVKTITMRPNSTRTTSTPNRAGAEVPREGRPREVRDAAARA